MDACLSKTNLVQQKDVRTSRNLRAACPRRCGLFSLTTPYTRVVILSIFSYQLQNAGAAGVIRDNAKLSATSTTPPVLGRRDATRRRTAGLPQVSVNFPEICPVCNCSVCSHQAGSLQNKTRVQTAVHPYQPVADATPQMPLFPFIAPNTHNETAAQPRRPKVPDSSWETFHEAHPRNRLSFATPSGTPPSAFAGWGEDERKDKPNSFSEEGEDDDEDDREAGVYAKPEWFIKRAAGSGGMRNMENFFKQWMRKRFGRKYDPGTCKKLKRDGRHPSAALRHSPIELFGYPAFDERSGRTFLERRLPLSIVQGYLVPIRVGAEDYVIQGTFDQISSFLECFEAYQAIASKLQPDGHWSADAEHGPLFLQVQNTLQDMESPFETNQVLFRWGFDRLIRVVAGARSVKTLTDVNAYDELMNIIDNVENVGDFLPHITREELFDFWEQLVQLPSIPDRVILLCVFLKRSFSRSPVAKNPRWIDDGALNLRKPLTVTLTSYPKPSRGLRATYRMESNVVTLGDVKEALSSLFQNSTMAYALRDLKEADGGKRNIHGR